MIDFLAYVADLVRWGDDCCDRLGFQWPMRMNSRNVMMSARIPIGDGWSTIDTSALPLIHRTDDACWVEAA